MHVYVPENFKKMLLNFGKHNEVEVLLGVLQGGLNNPDIQLQVSTTLKFINCYLYNIRTDGGKN